MKLPCSGIMTRAPLLLVAVALICGILIGGCVLSFPSSDFFLFGTGLLVGLFILLLLAWKYRALVSGLLCFLPFVGIGWLASVLHQPPEQQAWPSSDKVYRGIVTEMSLRQKGVNCIIFVTSMKKEDKWVSVNRRVSASISFFGLQDVKVGNALLFKAKIKRLDNGGKKYEGYVRWLKRKGVEGSAFLKHCLVLPEEVAESDIRQMSLSRRLVLTGLRIRTQLSHYYDFLDLSEEDDAAVMRALTLGDKSELSPDLKKTYALTGCSHVLALSGLHLGVLEGIFLIVLYRLRRNRKIMRAGALFSIAFIWGFVWMTGWSISLQRAAWMSTLWTLGMMRRCQTNSLSNLGGAACLLLIIDPNCVEDIGFQLSFLSVVSILLIVPPLHGYMLKVPKLLRWVVDLCAVSLAAQIGTLPLVVYYFGNIAVYGMFSSLVAIPCAYLLLGGGWLFILANVIGVSVACLGKLLGVTVHVMNQTLGVLSQYPCSVIQITSLAWWEVVLVYVCIGFVYAVVSAKLQGRRLLG